MVVPNPNPTKALVLKLMAEKEILVSRISEYGEILRNNGNVGMNGPLLDVDGFPRNDIDVYQVRQARQQIICLQNDHKALLKQIEEQMHKLHAEAAAEQEHQGLSHKAAGMQLSDERETDNISVGSSVSTQLQAIVKVNMISPGSPAEESGLQVGDTILEFGTVNSRNFQKDLNRIGDVVRHMQNQQVPLKIQRSGQQLDLILIPKIWNGRGLLGCNIVLPDA